jgi:hypothetical protein
MNVPEVIESRRASRSGVGISMAAKRDSLVFDANVGRLKIRSYALRVMWARLVILSAWIHNGDSRGSRSWFARTEDRSNKRQAGLDEALSF